MSADNWDNKEQQHEDNHGDDDNGASGVDDHTNLYVTDISQMSLEELNNLFSKYGRIVRSTVMENKHTGDKYGYGFVKFETEEEAQAAMEHMNGYLYNSKRIKVSVAIAKSINKTNVYVSGLPTTYTKKELDELCGQYGVIQESRVLTDINGQSKGVALVRFSTHDEAVRGVQALTGSVPPNGTHALTAKFAVEKPKQEENTRTTYSTRGAHDSSRGHSYSRGRARGRGRDSGAYNSYQRPSSGDYSRDSSSSSRGRGSYGAVRARSHQYQEPYVPTSSSSVPLPQKLDLFGTQDLVALYVYNFPHDVTVSHLFSLFSFYGPVSSVNIMKDAQTGQSKGYAFVNMFHRHDADNAIRHLNNNYQLGNKLLQVSFKSDKKN